MSGGISFFRYPGGKSKLRDQIAQRLAEQAEHDGLEFREPFFGGGSIGLKLLSDNTEMRKIWINDWDIGIACLWTSVIRYHDEFKERVRRFTPSVEAFYEMRHELTTLSVMPVEGDRIVDLGFKKLAVHQTSYSGLGTKSGGPLGGVGQKSQYKIDCRWSPDYICKKVDRLHDLFAAIEVRGNCCTNLDFADLIEDTHCSSLLYLDPPYYVKGNDLYQHGFTVEDHERLADALRNTEHMWVLSYDDCPEVRRLYQWAKVESLDVNYSITAIKDKDTGARVKYLAYLKDDIQLGLPIKPPKTPEKLRCNHHELQLDLPVACFTEWALSESQPHSSRYGRMAFGFSKPWVIKHGGQPVAYFSHIQKGLFLKNALALHAFLMGLKDISPCPDGFKPREITSALEQLLYFLSFTKPFAQPKDKEKSTSKRHVPPRPGRPSTKRE